MHVVFFVVEDSARKNFFEVGLQDAVLAGVVAHQGLPVLALDRTALVGAHEGPLRRERGLDAILEMLSDQMILKFAVLVLRSGTEPANHADVSGLGEDPFFRHFVLHFVCYFYVFRTKNCSNLFFLFN